MATIELPAVLVVTVDDDRSVLAAALKACFAGNPVVTFEGLGVDLGDPLLNELLNRAEDQEAVSWRLVMRPTVNPDSSAKSALLTSFLEDGPDGNPIIDKSDRREFIELLDIKTSGGNWPTIALNKLFDEYGEGGKLDLKILAEKLADEQEVVRLQAKPNLGSKTIAIGREIIQRLKEYGVL